MKELPDDPKELKPCPKCNSQDCEIDGHHSFRKHTTGTFSTEVYIYCNKCGIGLTFPYDDFPAYSEDELRGYAVTEWNTRATSQPQRPKWTAEELFEEFCKAMRHFNYRQVANNFSECASPECWQRLATIINERQAQ